MELLVEMQPERIPQIAACCWSLLPGICIACGSCYGKPYWHPLAGMAFSTDACLNCCRCGSFAGTASTSSTCSRAMSENSCLDPRCPLCMLVTLVHLQEPDVASEGSDISHTHGTAFFAGELWQAAALSHMERPGHGAHICSHA